MGKQDWQAAFGVDGPRDIGWSACARWCDCCHRRRLTYQLKPELGFRYGDRLCAECLFVQATAEHANAAQPPTKKSVAP